VEEREDEEARKRKKKRKREGQVGRREREGGWRELTGVESGRGSRGATGRRRDGRRDLPNVCSRFACGCVWVWVRVPLVWAWA
jgi:hypothetical protein